MAPREGELDYARFGRQLALREVGPDGQRALAKNPARFTGENAALAAHLHTRAGGTVTDDAGAPAHDAGGGASAPLALGRAAYAALEHARTVLALGAPRPMPPALLARLSLDEDPASEP